MRRRTLPLVSIPVAALLAVPAGMLPAEGSVSASASSASVSQASSLSTPASAERRRKQARYARPARATTFGPGVINGVRVSWRPAARAARYRVKWAYAPWDKWPAATRISGWMPASKRWHQTAVSTSRDDYRMTSVPYGNPVFARVQAANARGVGYWSRWRAIWPKLPRPADGDAVRLGTYNVMLAGTTNWVRRMPRIARNIAARGLGIVALQETMSTDGSGVARRLTSLTGHTWKVAPTGHAEGRILYDSRKFSMRDAGILNNYTSQRIINYRTGRVIPLPWAKFRAAGSDRSFTVVSVHFAPGMVSGSPTATANKRTGASARAVMDGLSNVQSSGPAVIAGDFAGGYGRWGDPNPAQPTLVRAGWWDSMASLSKAGVTYSTVNRRRAQRSTLAVAGRADGIFLRGIRGSFRYSNVANFFMPGTRVPPSDHNLVWSEFRVPR
ncbi:MAG: hypothetical protein ABWY19_04635 [Marmoricola sp.]